MQLKGDTGGKAELLKLLEETKQPVILACNEVMSVGKSLTGARLEKDSSDYWLLLILNVSKEALRNIARRVWKAESMDYDSDAIEAIVSNNPGDPRALVRDLQVICSADINL